MKKKVLITGGNGAIAKAIAELLLQYDYEVFCPGRDILDVTDYNNIVNVITNFKPDVLINNAGCYSSHYIYENKYDLEEEVIKVNLLATFWCTSVALTVNKDVVVINVGSTAAVEDKPKRSSYCASKAAVVMATKCWAKEGVRTVCISPGKTQSKLRRNIYPDEDQSTLLKPEDLAPFFLKAIDGCYNYGDNIEFTIDSINSHIL